MTDMYDKHISHAAHAAPAALAPAHREAWQAKADRAAEAALALAHTPHAARKAQAAAVLAPASGVDLEAWQAKALAMRRGGLHASLGLCVLLLLLFAAAIYAVAWPSHAVAPQAVDQRVVVPQAAPAPCTWRWRALRCSAGCKIRTPDLTRAARLVHTHIN